MAPNMLPDPILLQTLYKHYLEEYLSAEENNVLQEWLADPQHKEWLENFRDTQWLGERLKELHNIPDTEIWNRVHEQMQKTVEKPIDAETKPLPAVKRVHFLQTTWFKYAAAILLIIGGASVYYVFTTSKSPVEIADKKPYTEHSQIQPGTDRAILTLSDGRKVELSAASETIKDGTLSIENNNGQLTYSEGQPIPSRGGVVSPNGEHGVGSVQQFNTMTTPKGGQYKLILPDGSQVWLNSASALKYPVVFTGKTREVELNGEAYFEIKENKAKQFIVKTKEINVAVLGTAFNVNAYEDEPLLSTTLINGAVKVSTKSADVILKPEQQASFGYSDQKIKINVPDLEQVLAWKNGSFQFKKADIKSIMRQLSRWYDVTVDYRGPLPDAEFNGSLSRAENAEILLDALSLTNKVHFIVN
ncbi:MAG: FecR family protein [Chitinophagaceae bacterium]|nr:FecR family protein [Chitinophagaceae bacterium]